MTNTVIGILFVIAGLVEFIAIFYYFAHETFTLNSTQSTGLINFKANKSWGKMKLGDQKNNNISSGSTRIVETGARTNTCTIEYKSVNNKQFDRFGSKYTLIITEANSIKR